MSVREGDLTFDFFSLRRQLNFNPLPCKQSSMIMRKSFDFIGLKTETYVDKGLPFRCKRLDL